MHKDGAADELAEVRAAIARLRLREARLCAEILANPAGAVGKRFRAEVSELPVRRFDPSLLPSLLRDDPRFWRDTLLREVCCHPLIGSPPHPSSDAACTLH